MESVRWREAEPGAVIFDLRRGLHAGKEYRCEKLKAAEIRRWRWEGIGNVSHCRFQDGPLLGFDAWIKNAPRGVFVSVFTPQYLEFDREFADTLKNQGTTL